MHQTEDALGLLDQGHQFLGLLDRDRHGLFTHHMESGLEEVTRDREVPVVGCGHCHKVDALALGKSQFRLDHGLVV